MFKRLFGKAEEEASGLNMGRFTPAPAHPDPAPAQAHDLDLPSRKPPPRLDDLLLPDTLADEARRSPRDVNVFFDVSPKGATGSPDPPARAFELSDAQIDQIAQRVADKLATGLTGDRLRETVRQVVSDTSERLVRDEIARVRDEAERD